MEITKSSTHSPSPPPPWLRKPGDFCLSFTKNKEYQIIYRITKANQAEKRITVINPVVHSLRRDIERLGKANIAQSNCEGNNLGPNTKYTSASW